MDASAGRPAQTKNVAKGQTKALGAVILFGPPGAGKGTQARNVVKRFSIPHIATGDMIRQQIRAGSGLGKRVEATLAQGRLVDDDAVNRLVEARISRPDCRQGFLLDGFPRTTPQTKKLHEMLEQLGQAMVVIKIEIGYNELAKRITGRRLCPNCGAIYNIHSSPPQVSDVCDICKSRLVVRPDDQADVLEERLSGYERQTVPIFGAFRSNGQRIHEIDGTLPENEVARQIYRIIESA